MTKSGIDRTQYIRDAIAAHCLNGDAFVSPDKLFDLCREENNLLNYNTFLADLRYTIRKGYLYRQGNRIYDARIYQYEESAAYALSNIIADNHLNFKSTTINIAAGDVQLCPEQVAAVNMVLSHRFSMVLGSAGSGKTTIIRAIIESVGTNYLETVVCAPTGKAARNLESRIQYESRTIHSALGLRPNDDFLSPVKWRCIKLVIVDECGMMSLEMLAGILSRMHEDCRLVLLGDPRQLQAVGVGNIIADLKKIGIPYLQLTENHRLDKGAEALVHNVVHFDDLHCCADLELDDSFCMNKLKNPELTERLVHDAAAMYLRGDSVQVLSPYRGEVQKLNERIHRFVNPPRRNQLYVIDRNGNKYQNGDRVIITQNDRDHRCSNGDVGILRLYYHQEHMMTMSVELPDGRTPTWYGKEIYVAVNHIALAYAITVHKSQGSEYDTILFPASMSAPSMLNRNLFYTAISRAKERVLLYGDEMAIDLALHTVLDERKSMLVAKTHMLNPA